MKRSMPQPLLTTSSGPVNPRRFNAILSRGPSIMMAKPSSQLRWRATPRAFPAFSNRSMVFGELFISTTPKRLLASCLVSGLGFSTNALFQRWRTYVHMKENGTKEFQSSVCFTPTLKVGPLAPLIRVQPCQRKIPFSTYFMTNSCSGRFLSPYSHSVGCLRQF